MKDYRITVQVPEDLYKKWKAYAASQGIKAVGHGAKIMKFNSEFFNKSITWMLKKKKFL